MPKYADVSLPVSVEREFTYLVPPEIPLSVGVRVVVPLGRKFATGLVVGLPEHSDVRGLKPIRTVLDASPVVSPELLRLCRWIAEYYFAALGEVLRAANPGAFARPSKRLASPTRPLAESDLEEIARHAPKRARVLRILNERGPLSSSDIERLAGLKDITPTLNELERAGYITSEEILPVTKAGFKTGEFVLRESVRVEDIFSRLEKTPARNTRQRELLAAILRTTEQSLTDFPASQVLQRSGASNKALRPLVEQGLLATVRREVKRRQEYGTEEQTLNIVLNRDQQNVWKSIADAIDASSPKTFLLHGVTGSGKTQVYIECIRHVLAKGQSAIVLVPEISLTPQIVRRFKSHFGEQVAVVHSRMSIAERREVWRLAQRGDARIVIGPRSAVFAPLRNLGLIVVDEEHEASYKQFDALPRYHARDVAVVRGSFENAVVVLGSATPSVESYHNALHEKYTLLELPRRIDEVPMPAITIVDMTAERKRIYAELKESLPPEGRVKLKDFQQPGISALLQTKIQDRLRRKEGIILLQNRRGFAPFVECPECGYTETCENCNVTLTYHLTQKHLRCHYCGMVRRPYIVCPQCGSAGTRLHGIGTQRVEEDLAKLFPEARILRMDLDTTTRKGAHDRLLRRFGNRDADILLGTQMVAKGLDFPHVTLVGVISADTQMLLPDFRSAERTFQLLTQVAGRAGRSNLLGEVIIQTHQPRHYTLAHVIDHDFAAFYKEEVANRQELEYPPFSRLVLIEAKGGDEGRVRKTAEKFASSLKKADGSFTVLGPAPAVIGKIKNQYRWHIIVKNAKSKDPGGHLLRQVLQKAKAFSESERLHDVRLFVDADPAGLM
jgi:primosomal protein N' (replication factor Y) (superfamily II helicase)